MSSLYRAWGDPLVPPSLYGAPLSRIALGEWPIHLQLLLRAASRQKVNEFEILGLLFRASRAEGLCVIMSARAQIRQDRTVMRFM